MKEMKKSIVATSLLYILIGLVLVIYPALPFKLITYVIAGLLAVIGIVQIITFFTKKIGDTNNNGLFTGMIMIFVAAFACWKVDMLVELLPLVLGFIIVISGILTLQDAVNTMRIRSMSWVVLLITALVKIGLGLFIVLYTFEALELAVRIVGVGFLISGISDFIITKYVASKIQSFLSKKAPSSQVAVEAEATVVEDQQ
ncbi:MAG: hypothetical protein E7385_07990 [Ruminococcaceae bacterium]|nr:hypothetical protein [Oscillospiraceae bacterium]